MSTDRVCVSAHIHTGSIASVANRSALFIELLFIDGSAAAATMMSERLTFQLALRLLLSRVRPEKDTRPQFQCLIAAHGQTVSRITTTQEFIGNRGEISR